MRLSGQGAAVELSLVGYAMNSDKPSDDPDSDWLTVDAVVSGDRDTRTYRGLSLDVAEARRLGSWLRAAATGNISPTPESVPSPALLHFIEPGLATRLVSHDEATATVRWCFYDPDGSRIPSETGLLDYPVHSIVITTSHSALQSAAQSWLRDLAQLQGPG